MLTKMKIRDSTKCQYCPGETDYIEHSFLYKKCAIMETCGMLIILSFREKITITVKSLI